MQRDEVDDEDVATPRRDHVEVGQGSSGGPHDRACFDRLDPQEVGEEKSKDCDPFVVVRTGYGARDVSRDDGYETRSEEGSTGVPYFTSQ